MSASVTVPRTVRHQPRLTTPVQLRVWALALMVGAVALPAVTSIGVLHMRDQVHRVGDSAAPQAATASDLYVALSDLDAQVARLIMLGDAESVSANRLDALRTYQQRSAEVDEDLAQAVRGAADDADRQRLADLVDGMALYRQRAWQAIAVQGETPDQQPGSPPDATLGYYAQATNVLHSRLLPDATALRLSSQDTLDRTYAAQRYTAELATVFTVLCGAALIAGLVLFQLRLARRHRRLANPALLLATACSLGLVIAACVVFADETQRLRDAQRTEFGPYLALTQAQAISYDAAGDTSRYLFAPSRAAVQDDLQAKSQCLVQGGSCKQGGDTLAGGLATLAAGPDTSDAQARSVLDRWNAYKRDNDKIVGLANSGQLTDAVDTLTGIARGDAAFDFYFYDTSVSDIATQRRNAFGQALSAAESELAPWPVIPAVLMVFTILLVLLGVRPRLAEYR